MLRLVYQLRMAASKIAASSGTGTLPAIRPNSREGAAGATLGATTGSATGGGSDKSLDGLHRTYGRSSGIFQRSTRRDGGDERRDADRLAQSVHKGFKQKHMAQHLSKFDQST